MGVKLFDNFFLLVHHWIGKLFLGCIFLIKYLIFFHELLQKKKAKYCWPFSFVMAFMIPIIPIPII